MDAGWVLGVGLLTAGLLRLRPRLGAGAPPYRALTYCQKLVLLADEVLMEPDGSRSDS